MTKQKKQGDDVKQRRPRGRAREMTPEWKRRVRDELKEQGKDQKWLADETGATEGGISQMLHPDTATSKYVDITCDKLNLPPPTAPVADERDMEWILRGKQLRAIDPEKYDQMAERLRRLVDRRH